MHRERLTSMHANRSAWPSWNEQTIHFQKNTLSMLSEKWITVGIQTENTHNSWLYQKFNKGSKTTCQTRKITNYSKLNSTRCSSFQFSVTVNQTTFADSFDPHGFFTNSFVGKRCSRAFIQIFPEHFTKIITI